MAGRAVSTLSLRSQIREDHLTCTICFLQFERPKALPCLHTFCEGCIRDYVTGRGYEQVGSFPCPVCRVDIQIPPGGIVDFADNHLVHSLTDTVDKAKKTTPVHNMTPPLTTMSEPELSLTNPATGISSLPQSHLYPDLPDPASFYPKEPEIIKTILPCSDKMILNFGKYGGNVLDFQKPFGLAVGQSGEYIVTDRGGNRIFIFSNDGKLKNKFACNCLVNGITVTKENNILVAVSRSKSSIMRLYSMEGRLLEEHGAFYRYDNPSGIAVTSDNHVIVSNLEGDNIYIFTEQRKFSSKFGWKGSGDQHFMNPHFVAVDRKDHIIVSDTGNNCVKVFDKTGKFKYKFGRAGSQTGCFNQPMGVAVDKEDNIIVADSNNCRVEVYSPKGKHLSCVVKDTDLIGPTVRPINVAVTPRNNIVVLLTGMQYVEVRVYLWHNKKASTLH